MRHPLSKFRLDESGATTLEYAFIASLISIVVFASTKYMGKWVGIVFQSVGGNLSAS